MIRSALSPAWRGPMSAASCSPIEGVMMPGKGKMTVTGNLRDVMKESISAAAILCPLARRRFRVSSRRCSIGGDIHVHVPEGRPRKDGPSAGVAMATAIVANHDRHPGPARCSHDRRDPRCGDACCRLAA